MVEWLLNVMAGEARCARRICSPKIWSCGGSSVFLWSAINASATVHGFASKPILFPSSETKKSSLSIHHIHGIPIFLGFVGGLQMIFVSPGDFSCFIIMFLFYHDLMMWRSGIQNLSGGAEGCSEGFEEVKVET